MTLPAVGNQQIVTATETILTFNSAFTGSVPAYVILSNNEAVDVYISIDQATYSGNETEFVLIKAGKQLPIALNNNNNTVYAYHTKGSNLRLDWSINAKPEI